MGAFLHANARTTPKTRAEIQASPESVAVLSWRYNVSEPTIRLWRSRVTQVDGSHVRHNLGQSTSPDQEALIGELRRFVGLSLDDICEVMGRCSTPSLSRSAIWRALGRMGLQGRTKSPASPAISGIFEPTAPGFVHIDLKYLSRLKGIGEFVFVAIERTTRFVHAEVLPDRRPETISKALTRFLQVCPIKVHTILTDNGSEFTDRFATGSRDGAAARPTGRHPFDLVCAAAAGTGIKHRLTKPYSPATNGMVERFNRRIAEALRAIPQARDNSRKGTKFTTHTARKAFIMGFVATYNLTRLRCLNYKSP